jgi:hypothetical protein
MVVPVDCRKTSLIFSAAALLLAQEKIVAVPA